MEFQISTNTETKIGPNFRYGFGNSVLEYREIGWACMSKFQCEIQRTKMDGLAYPNFNLKLNRSLVFPTKKTTFGNGRTVHGPLPCLSHASVYPFLAPCLSGGLPVPVSLVASRNFVPLRIFGGVVVFLPCFVVSLYQTRALEDDL